MSETNGEIDADHVGITFDDMKVKIPFLSVWMLVRDDDGVYVGRKGG